MKDSAFHCTHGDAQFFGNLIVVKAFHEHIEWDLKFWLQIIDGTANVLLVITVVTVSDCIDPEFR